MERDVIKSRFLDYENTFKKILTLDFFFCLKELGDLQIKREDAKGYPALEIDSKHAS